MEIRKILPSLEGVRPKSDFRIAFSISLIADTSQGWIVIRRLSGTASVVGHETHHENQVANQLSESLRNVQALLREGCRLTGDSHAGLDSEGMLKVYIRNPEDLEQIKRTLQAEAPAELPRIYLQGDICRDNLLTEIDGIVSFGGTRHCIAKAEQQTKHSADVSENQSHI